MLDTHEFWEYAWDAVDYKSDQFSALMHELAVHNKIGEVVVDVGAGAVPVTRLLDRDYHKVIEVDCASDEANGEKNTLRLRFNIEDVVNNRENTRIALAKVIDFLDIDADQCDFSRRNLEQVDAFVFSQILNYIDYKAVLKALKQYLKPGGQLIFNERAGLGVERAKSAAGLSNFQDLAAFLQGEGYWPSVPIIDGSKFIWRVQKPLDQ